MPPLPQSPRSLRCSHQAPSTRVIPSAPRAPQAYHAISIFNGSFALPDPYSANKRPLLVYPANNYANAGDKPQQPDTASGVKLIICASRGCWPLR